MATSNAKSVVPVVPAVAAAGAAAAAARPAPAVKAPARAKFPASAVVTVLVVNPKRGASAARFALYGAGVGATTTVAAYVAAAGKYGYPDLAWDLAREFISIA